MAKELGGDIGVGDVVKNSLPEEISLKGPRISVKRCFALRRAVEVVPRLGRHLLARNGSQLPKPHLL